NSTSPAKPSWPERLLRFTTGNTTLIDFALTPRVLVLAWSTGVPAAPSAVRAATSWGPEPAGAETLGRLADPERPGGPVGVLGGALATYATRPPTVPSATATVRSCMARGRRRKRRAE